MQHHFLQPETGFSKPRVFLGGTCNGSLWRNELISLLQIDYFNPVTENWTPEHQHEEQRQREICDYCLYTLTPKMAGVFSIAELVEDSVKRPEKTVLCLLEQDAGEQFTGHQWKSLEATAQLVRKNGAHVFYALSDVGLFLNIDLVHVYET